MASTTPCWRARYTSPKDTGVGFAPQRFPGGQVSGRFGHSDLQPFDIRPTTSPFFSGQHITSASPPITGPHDPETVILNEFFPDFHTHRTVNGLFRLVEIPEAIPRVPQEKLGNEMPGKTGAVDMCVLDALLHILHLSEKASKLPHRVYLDLDSPIRQFLEYFLEF